MSRPAPAGAPLAVVGAGVCALVLAAGAAGRTAPDRCVALACAPHGGEAVQAGGRQQAGGKDGDARAQDPRGRGADGADDHAGREWRRRGDGGWGRGETRSPTAPEWAEAHAFMMRYSPQRQRALEDLPEGDKKESIKRFVFARYRGLQALAQRDRAAFDRRVAQLAVEDKIFGLVSQWGGADEEQRKQMREDLKAKVSQLVELDLQERRRKVEKLQAELEEQKQDLDRDQNDRDALVERRLSRFLDWANRSPPRDKDAKDTKSDPSDKPKDGGK